MYSCNTNERLWATRVSQFNTQSMAVHAHTTLQAQAGLVVIANLTYCVTVLLLQCYTADGVQCITCCIL